MRCLLIIDPTGAVVLADADNDVRVELSAGRDRGEGTRATTVAWSPAGQWTAWSTGSTGHDTPDQLHLHDEATDTTRILADALSAFYLCPSPCGRYLSHLSPGPLGLELGLTDIRTGELRILERGQPLFLAWSPDASRLAVHVENRLVIVSPEGGAPDVFSENAGRFIAPWWMAGGSTAGVVGGDIVARGPDGAVTTVLEGSGTGRFAVDPDGRRLALIEVDDDEQRLVAIDLLTEQRTTIMSGHCAAFFWSPDGLRLAALVPASASELQWIVYDGGDVARLSPFRPGRTWFETVLPFFEQYTQSHSLWSADGRRLVVVALDRDGRSNALVQGVEPPWTTDWFPAADLVWWAEG